MALEIKEGLGNKIQRKERKERKIRIKAWENNAWQSILNARELIFWRKSSLHFLITSMKMCRSWFSLFSLWSQKAYLMPSLCHSQCTALRDANRSDKGLPQCLSLWNLPSSYITSPQTLAWISFMPLLHLQNRKKEKNPHKKFMTCRYLRQFHFSSHLYCLPWKTHKPSIFYHAHHIIAAQQ